MDSLKAVRYKLLDVEDQTAAVEQGTLSAKLDIVLSATAWSCFTLGLLLAPLLIPALVLFIFATVLPCTRRPRFPSQASRVAHTLSMVGLVLETLLLTAFIALVTWALVNKDAGGPSQAG